MASRERRTQVSTVLPCDCVVGGLIPSKNAGSKEKTKWPQPLYPTKAAEAQDKMYGKGMRLHNERVAKNKPVGFTCTICGTRKN